MFYICRLERYCFNSWAFLYLILFLTIFWRSNGIRCLSQCWPSHPNLKLKAGPRQTRGLWLLSHCSPRQSKIGANISPLSSPPQSRAPPHPYSTSMSQWEADFFPLVMGMWSRQPEDTDFSLYPKFRLINRLTAGRPLRGGQIGLRYGIYWTRFVCLRAKSICGGLANRGWEGGQFVWEISNVRWERTLRLLCQICKTHHGHIANKHGGHS